MESHRLEYWEKVTRIGLCTLRTAIHNGLLDAYQPGRGRNSPFYVTEHAMRQYQENRKFIGRRTW